MQEVIAKKKKGHSCITVSVANSGETIFICCSCTFFKRYFDTVHESISSLFF